MSPLENMLGEGGARFAGNLPCQTVQSVVLMLDGLIEVKKLAREL